MSAAILIFVIYNTGSKRFQKEPQDSNANNVVKRESSKRRALKQEVKYKEKKIANQNFENPFIAVTSGSESNKKQSSLPSVSKKEPELAPNHVLFKVEMKDWAVTQGDVLLGKLDPQVPIQVGQAKAQPIQLWPHGVIPYLISEDYPYPELVEDVIEYFHENSPVRFVKATNQKDGIFFQVAEENCFSYLGKVGGFQPVFLSLECRGPHIIHELMHVLGFIHEQSRSDRDEFVNINWEVIDPDYLSQFTKVPPLLMSVSGKAKFDYNSVMLYESKAFSWEAETPAIESKTPKKISPTREGLSAGDLLRIRVVYGK